MGTPIRMFAWCSVVALSLGAGTTLAQLASGSAGDSPEAKLPEHVDASQLTEAERRELSDRWTREARRLIAAGQYDTARQWARKALELDVKRYGLFDDTPRRVLDDLAQMQQRKEGGSPNATVQDRRQQSDALLAEAELLLRQGKYDEAEERARQARQLGAHYDLFDLSPDKLIDRIAEARTAAGGAPRGVASQGAALQRYPAPTGGRSNPANAATTPNEKKAAAVRLLKEAKAALAAGRLDEAEAKAREAQQHDVVYTLFEDRPEIVLADIRFARRRKAQQNRFGRSTGIVRTASSEEPDLSFSAVETDSADDSVADTGESFSPESASDEPSERDVAAPRPLSIDDQQEPSSAGTASGRKADRRPKSNRAKVRELLARAKDALKHGDLSKASALAVYAKSIPARFGPNEETPDSILRQVSALKRRRVTGAGAISPLLIEDDGPKPQELSLDPTSSAAPASSDSGAGSTGESSPDVAQASASAPVLPVSNKTVIQTSAEQELPEAAQPTESEGRPAAQNAAQFAEIGALAMAEPGSYPAVSAGPESRIDAAPSATAEAPVHPERMTPQQRKDLAVRWTSEARKLLEAGKYEEARSRANKARRLRVKFSLFEDSPERVLDDVVKALRSQYQSRTARSQKGYQSSGLRRPSSATTGSAAPQTGTLQSARTTSTVERTKPVERLQAATPGGGAASKTSSFDSQPFERAQASAGSNQEEPYRLQSSNGFRTEPLTLGSSVAKKTESPDAAGESDLSERTASVAVAQAPAQQPAPAEDRYRKLLEEGKAALRRGDRKATIAAFTEILESDEQVDPVVRQQAQEYMNVLLQPGGEQNGNVRRVAAQETTGGFLTEAQRRQQIKLGQVQNDTINALVRAKELLAQDSDRAEAILNKARATVVRAELPREVTDRLVRQIDAEKKRVEQYRQQHAQQIELQDANRDTEEQVRREEQHKIEIQQEVADLVEEFNTLMDEGRYAEAELLAQQAAEIDPNNPVTEVMVWKAQFVRRIRQQEQIRDAKEEGWYTAMTNTDIAAIPFDDNKVIEFMEARKWQELTERRKQYGDSGRVRRTPAEIEIDKSLNEPVSLNFEQAPLSEVIQSLQAMTGVNIVLDPVGLEDEGVASNTPVTIQVQQIKLRSALNLILEPMRLTTVIRNEVLKVTSLERSRGELITVTYDVADLVMPIPSLVGNMNLNQQGLQRLLAAGNGNPLPPVSVVATPTNSALQPAADGNQILAQINGQGSIGGMGGRFPGESAMPGSAPPPGGAAADFDSLIDLIEKTIEPESWEPIGEGTIEEFDLNLSLIIRNTQDVHDSISDLLDQLRRLLDLQLTIEVRFVELEDNFFERIGVDFDFDINDKIDEPYFEVDNFDGQRDFGKAIVFGEPDEEGVSELLIDAVDPTEIGFPIDPTNNFGRLVHDQDRYDSRTIVGLSAPGVFSSDLDIPFMQDSFGAAVPLFGGFNPASGASLGFAIMNDIEAFLFMQAATQDNRTNITQAPKVTLFNGQFATVFELTQQFFVLGQVPIVGAAAVGFQPIIVPFPSGTFLGVTGVISADRRFVRVTVFPFFFSLSEGATVTQAGGVAGGGFAGDAETGSITIQLPQITTTSVQTTVNVPDGGTILLGGIKRMSENRREAGVPILRDIAYINRLFKNVGIGRDARSLMMMVTPRIIIQEEEEQLLGIAPTL